MRLRPGPAWLLIGTAALGAVLLRFALQSNPGEDRFYVITVLLPPLWITAAVLAGPVQLRLGHIGHSLLTGGSVAALGIVTFTVGDELTRHIKVIHQPVVQILQRADARELWLVLLVAAANGIAEEVFFRGAVYDAFAHRPVVRSTAVYVAVTAVGGNLAMDTAAAVMGGIFALVRRRTGGLLAPALTHVLWSVLVVLVLPR